MNSQTSQFQIQVKINSQDYSNCILSNFKHMISHQSPIPWIINKQPRIKFKSLKITNESCSILRYKLHYVFNFIVLGSKDIFKPLKNQQSSHG